MERIVKVQVKSNDFARGLRYAKSFGGTFNRETKLWTIDLGRQIENVNNSLRAPGAYGLVIVEGKEHIR